MKLQSDFIDKHGEDSKEIVKEIFKDSYSYPNEEISNYKELLVFTDALINSDIVEKFLKLSPEIKCELFYNFDSFVFLRDDERMNVLATYLVALEIAGNPFPVLISRQSRTIGGVTSAQRFDRYVSIASESSKDFDEAVTKYFMTAPRTAYFIPPLVGECISYLLRSAYGEADLIEIMKAASNSPRFISIEEIMLLREQWRDLKHYPIDWSVQTLPDFSTYDFIILKPSELFDPIE